MGGLKCKSPTDAGCRSDGATRTEYFRGCSVEAQAGDTLWGLAAERLGEGASNADILAEVQWLKEHNQTGPEGHIRRGGDVSMCGGPVPALEGHALGLDVVERGASTESSGIKGFDTMSVQPGAGSVCDDCPAPQTVDEPEQSEAVSEGHRDYDHLVTRENSTDGALGQWCEPEEDWPRVLKAAWNIGAPGCMPGGGRSVEVDTDAVGSKVVDRLSEIPDKISKRFE